MRGEFDFSLKNVLNKTLVFDTSKINREVITDEIIELINDPLIDEYYIDHPSGINSFTLNEKMEDKKTLKKAKNIFKVLTTDSNSVLFAQEKIGNRLLKNFKKIKIGKRFFTSETYSALWQ